MSLFKKNRAIIAVFSLSLLISATDTQAQTATTTSNTYTQNGITISVDMQEAMQLANQLYPGLFRTPSVLRQITIPEGTFTYRFYRDSSTYIGFNDGKIYLMGGAFGNKVTEYGEVNTVLGQLRTLYEEKFGQPVDIPDIPDVEIPEGDFDLTISGQFTVFGFSNSFGGIVIEKIPAPGPSDIDEMTDILVEQADLQNLRNVSVQQIENSANRVVFDIELTADTAAGAATYKLRYTYVRR
jgi:hypothetical protein